MSELQWDQAGERFFETGTDHGVLYVRDNSGEYPLGVPWNGLTAVTESPSGAEATPLYADNIKYLELRSAEEFGATIEAYTYPPEFGVCDGTATPTAGVSIGQQGRKSFGFVWRTKKGNDLDSDLGYKLHLVYGATAAPSEKAYATVNDSPEAVTFSWEVTTSPVSIDGYKPTAIVVIDSTEVEATALAALETILFGSVGADARLPMPNEVVALFEGTVTVVTATAPTYNSTTDTVTIPSITGVVYEIDGEVVTGDVVITEDVLVTAHAGPGYVLSPTSDDDWAIDFV